MPEGDQQQESLGWRAGLPDNLKTHEALVPYKTVGELGSAYIETVTKAKDFEGKLGNSIPKLSDSATPEERAKFFNSLGRPEKPEGYQLEDGTKEKEDMLNPWKQDFHELGLTASQAKGLKAKWDGRLNGIVEQHNAAIAAANTKAETELKTEWGDKYDTNRELVSRLWKRDTDSEFDQAFKDVPFATQKSIMRYMFKMAAKTGEDTSQRGSAQRSAEQSAFINYDKSPAPPRRVV